MDDDDAVRVARHAAERAGVTVRALHALDELRAAHQLVLDVWRPAPHSPPVTVELLRALTHAGNYAAGAYATDDGALLGVCLGFFAAPPGRTMHSQIAGVRPGGRARGVGYALKLHQRGWALARGLTEVTWTFDPLIRRNARFNLAKLGARPREYLVDFYGDMADAINAGQGSDRLLLAWDLTAPVRAHEPVAAAPANAVGPVAAAVTVGPDGGPALPPPAAWHDAARVTVAVPADIEQLRADDPAAARRWRHAVRDTLGRMLAAGGAVTGFTGDGYVVAPTRAAGEETT